MIGPHQGKELELMLAGQKCLAMFHDAVVENQTISEIVIPENSFASYIKDHVIKKFSRIFDSPQILTPVKYVCFTLPGHEWRAEAFFWMHEECISGRRPFDDSYEYFVGRLLDYTEEDILHFIQHRKKIPA